MDSPVGFPLSGNPQPSETPPSLLHPSPSTNGSPLSPNSQSSESSTDSPAASNGPTAIISAEEMQEGLCAMTFHTDFSRFVRGGRCRNNFNNWYACMDRAIYHGENAQCCFWLAAILRNCMLENYDYYGPFLSEFRRRTHP